MADPRPSGGSLFRIYRDTRFSKDKSPYKTHAGACLYKDGEKEAPGLLYIHLAPEGCFVAAGFHMPEADALAALRQAIAGQAKAFAAVEKKLAAAKLEVGGHGDALKRLPRGFEDVTDARTAELVKQKSYVVQRPVAAKALHDAKLVGFILDFVVDARPLLDFGWKALA